jgi:Polyketide cyclase / dehydrase and lipid transport
MAVYIGVAVLVLIVAVIAFIATRPTNSRIQRSAQINAPADVVFSIINDLRRWAEWSPYDKRDPNMKKTFEGPSAGPGAIYIWNGNSQVGEGRLTIVESKPGELVSMRLEFSRPFKCNNEVNFKIVPSDGGTRVSWIMDGKNNFIGKFMSLIMDMDKMVGTDFEHGLANLNTVAQAEAQKSAQSTQASVRVG